MALITLLERLRVPAYDNPEHCSMGEVSIDREKCNGCGLCVKVCPINVLYLEGAGKEKELRVNPHLQQCCACNDCMAICERGAITAVKSSNWLYRYKQVMREGFAPPRGFRT